MSARLGFYEIRGGKTAESDHESHEFHETGPFPSCVCPLAADAASFVGCPLSVAHGQLTTSTADKFDTFSSC
jgi:hypothetical protein